MSDLLKRLRELYDRSIDTRVHSTALNDDLLIAETRNALPLLLDVAEAAQALMAACVADKQDMAELENEDSLGFPRTMAAMFEAEERLREALGRLDGPVVRTTRSAVPGKMRS